MQPTADAVRKRWILALTCLAQFMVILDISVVNVALPSIRQDLGFSAVDLQWVVNAYTLTFAGFLLLGGRAADRMRAPALALGADRYLEKGEPLDVIRDAVREVALAA